jgi:hypothetical protein
MDGRTGGVAWSSVNGAKRPLNIENCSTMLVRYAVHACGSLWPEPRTVNFMPGNGTVGSSLRFEYAKSVLDATES